MRRAEAAMLMLCCALGQQVEPLTAAQYSTLAQRMAMELSDSREGQADAAFFRSLGYAPDFAVRLEQLLDRERALERYLSALPGLQVLTRISADFPQQLRSLGRECPAALFCLGDTGLLHRPAVALVGARRLSMHSLPFAERIGRLAAREGYVLVSGGAEGADRTAQEACLEAGGSVICFVPDRLSEHALRERVLYCSLDGYDYPFSAWRALARNHLIHALGSVTFVAQCRERKGGTWAGATDNLRRNLSPLYIWWEDCEGMRALRDLGATPMEQLPSSIRPLEENRLSIFNDILLTN